MDEKVQKFLQHPATISTFVGVVALAGGGVGGFFLGRKIGRQQMIDMHNKAEEEKARRVVDKNQHTFEFPPQPDKLVIDADDIPELEQIRTEALRDVNIEKDGVIVRDIVRDVPDGQDATVPTDLPIDDAAEAELATGHNGYDVALSFAESGEGWDLEAEMDQRRADLPYIIHSDEFISSDFDFPQQSLTYYEGDGILADENGQVVHNPGHFLGELRWGHGTTDPNAVYIRNERRKVEYEVMRHTGSYEHEVLGLEDESPVPAGPPRFTDSDD